MEVFFSQQWMNYPILWLAKIWQLFSSFSDNLIQPVSETKSTGTQRYKKEEVYVKDALVYVYTYNL